jgi:hypothetical protein
MLVFIVPLDVVAWKTTMCVDGALKRMENVSDVAPDLKVFIIRSVKNASKGGILFLEGRDAEALFQISSGVVGRGSHGRVARCVSFSHQKGMINFR